MVKKKILNYSVKSVKEESHKVCDVTDEGD